MITDIKCSALRGEKINELRCKMQRAENVKFWGDRSKEMTGCPCKNMEVMTMGTNAKMTYKKIGECPVCGKVDSRLYACHGRDLCGKCKCRYYKPRKKESEIPVPGTVEKGYNTPAATEQIVLRFLDQTDAEILAFLKSKALSCRRTIEQQVMWLLQSCSGGGKGE